MSAGQLHSTTITTGGLAIVGYQDNASTDSFTVLATEDISAGTEVYFTNNGWSNDENKFFETARGNYTGGQQLMKMTVNTTISRGTVFSSADTGNSSFSWTTSGHIPGTINNAFSVFSSLDFLTDGDPSGASDQIYILQAATSSPLDNISNFIFALDFGDPNANPSGFVEPGSRSDGAIPNGLVRLDGIALDILDTGSALSDQTNGDPNDNTAVALDPGYNFHDGIFGLDLSNPDFISLNLLGGTKEDWLLFLNNSAHWSSLSSLPTGTSLLNVTAGAIPEPSRAVLFQLGLAVAVLRHRRRCMAIL